MVQSRTSLGDKSRRWPGMDVDAHDDLPDFGENPKAAIAHLAAILDAHEAMCGRRVRLLALDNRTLMAGKLDPNKTETVNAVLKPLSDFAHERGISVVVAAHENRQGRENGSFAWKALCDNMLTLKAEKGVRTIGFKKSREGDTEGKVTFKLDVIVLGKNKWATRIRHAWLLLASFSTRSKLRTTRMATTPS
jgi:hypothetical protein